MLKKRSKDDKPKKTVVSPSTQQKSSTYDTHVPVQ